MNTSLLLMAIDHGAREGFNRTVDITSIERIIDPSGLHVVDMLLMYHQAARPFPDHHRISVLMKKTGVLEPAQFMLDVHVKYWEQARDIHEVMEILTTPEVVDTP